ncbi:hypothetical protein D9619_004116 [Psilocybe cf. subviscida]|uniref:HD/PDEase domain-containing protein n=1 Tax=Psilocybe cf. subviscida TaxID=2480587 RepID=A0A8H5F8Z4_9AGAR|nr:hypothetical protein D9619_004116 [Psilocybe cf. subviscida]
MTLTTQEQAVVAAAEKMMIEAMARCDPSHDKYHVQRVRKTALAIAQSLSPTPDLLTVELGARHHCLAALLHDMLDKKYVGAELAGNPYAFFEPFFKSMADLHGVDLLADGRARLIADVVDNVSWTTETKLLDAGMWTEWHATCRELHCVQDADRLDAIGAFGVMRCAAFTMKVNKPLHTPPGEPGESASAIGHFYDKLFKIHDRLKTEPGKKMGANRHRLLLDFVTAIDEEYEATI